MVFFAFVLGAVSVLAVELLALYWILRRLGRARSGGRSVRSRDGIGNEDEIGVREYAASDASLCRGVEKQVMILYGVFLDCYLVVVVLLTVRTGLFRVIFGSWSWSKDGCWNKRARRSSSRFSQSRSSPKSKRMISY